MKSRIIKKCLWCGSAALLLAVACAAPRRQFYPDSFYPQDGIYENKPLRFLLTFSGNWHLFTDPEEMDKGSREFAHELQKAGVELLFVGASAEALHGTRAIAANLNETPVDYAEQIQRINKDDVQNDQGLVDFLAGDHAMTKWVYDKAGFRFAEFFFCVGTYNIRIAFWTKPQLFEKFLPVYEEIVSSLTFTGGL
jgi:hypothetical protein